MNNKYLSAIALGVAVITALFVFTAKPAVQTAPPAEQVVGAAPGTDHYNYEQFLNGVGALYFKTTSSGSSSSSPAALTSTSSGHFVVAASATTANASTTAITVSTDKVFLMQEGTTPIAGTTCNTAIASGTSVSTVIVSATSTLNGFKATVQPAPTTNPYCFEYFIVK